MSKLIDILIPYYKGDIKLLKRLLDSIAIQSGVDFELINVIALNDDFDFDTLQEFRKQCKYPFSFQIIARKHGGISATRNDLLSKATADYVIFCDQDDYFIDNYILSKYAQIIKKESYGIAPEVLISPIKHINILGQTRILSANIDNIQGTLLHGRAFKTSFLKENNIVFLPCLDGMEDYYFVNLALQLSKKTICIEGEPTYCWANDNINSVTNSMGASWFTNNLSILIRGNSILMRELINRGLYEAAGVTATVLLISLYRTFLVHKELNENTELANAIKINLYFYLAEFEYYFNHIPKDKLEKLYSLFSAKFNNQIDAEAVRLWFKVIKKSVLSLKNFKLKNGFSIIIPTHNRIQMLTKAIDSVVAQKYPNYEIILCDDHCTDGTENFIKHKYKNLINNNILKYIKSEGSGAANARNTAIKYITKPWVAYLDDDNTQLLNFLNIFNYNINSNPDYKCFYGKWLNTYNKLFYFKHHDFDYEALTKANYIDLGVFVHSADLVKKYGTFDTDLTALLDWDLILRYTKTEKTMSFDTIVLSYCDGKHDRITNANKFYENMYKIRKKIIGKNLPSVSTIIISYNQVNYIKQALESAIAQEGIFKHKILVSDDCSTDGTQDIIKEYAINYPDLITIISPKKHLGGTANYWRAISKVKTEYIAILEGDDYWLENKLNKCIERLEDDKTLGLVFNEIELLKTDANGFISKTHFKTGNQNTVLTEKDLLDCGNNNFCINLSSCVLRTKIFNNVPADIKTKYVFSEIPMQFFVVNSGYTIGRVPETLSIYRVHQDGIWSGASNIDKAKMYYNNRRAAFDVASVAAKKHLYPILKEKQKILVENNLISQDEIDALDSEYFKLPGTNPVKGIILAGGTGSRLYPITMGVNKNLLPVYDKPLVYYPLSLLMLAGIKDILIISDQEHLGGFKNLLGDGSNFGINIEYATQYQANGIAEAFTIGKDFIGMSSVVLVLGDNIFYGADIVSHFNNSLEVLEQNKASIYAYHVKEPERFGIINLDENNEPIDIEEKPINPKSNYCVTGLYFYPNDVVKYASSLTPSKRGELEITDINNIYLKQKRLNVELLGRGYAWFDAGKPESLLLASNFISAIQENENLVVACLEEIAYVNGWISKEQLQEAGEKMKATAYGKHILNIISDKIVR